ncbi:MAG: L-histidine N(alpha)-methyltransferase [Nitrospinota bacterium]|jgi:dimethylhistidine N-methyltransferase|nr:L-histidine N(alpha)-methyltransferase [Nitrospinota bacterium]HJP53731.1 L-histidine N(alpha)-methyltransferase [Rhodospirillales bacterium]
MPNTLAAFHDQEPVQEDFRAAVIKGLTNRRKTLPCKFFYDERGSELFEEICRLDEYYPTRTETALFQQHAGEIAEHMGSGCHLLEFGSGACVKVRILLDALEEPRAYVPIDISRDHLIQSAKGLAQDFPDLPVIAVCADYTEPLVLPNLEEGRRVGFFPGSTIGNFTREEAVAFLNSAHDVLKGGGLVIGIDLMKDDSTLKAAYDDAKGVTAAFNKNILARCNREIGATFDLGAFFHRATVNREKSRVEMHLVSTRDQLVSVAGRSIAFREGETIHTESSHKYTLEEFRDLTEQAGFRTVNTWVDSEGLFSVHFLEAA